MAAATPGPVALLGSGETAPTSGPVYEALARRGRVPLLVAVLETPAGFQPNAAAVAGRVAEFLRVRLQNYKPQVRLVAARERGTPASPDDPEVTAPILDADLLFLGAGSPTYTVRQLAGSLAWERLLARHQAGAAIATASAATIAMGALALPVYEIYKAGEPLHWRPGLDLFGRYGLRLVVLPHWNNAEGGAELDTSRCFMGRARYERLLALLPPEITVVGIDEHTALLLDPAAGVCEVLGRGGVTPARGGVERRFARKTRFAITELGPFRPPAPPALAPPAAPAAPSAAPAEVMALVAARQEARARRDWATADALRREIAAHGWQVRDTPAGPRLEPG